MFLKLKDDFNSFSLPPPPRTVGKFLKGSANVKVPQRIPLSGFPRSLELFVLSDSQLRSRDAQFV